MNERCAQLLVILMNTENPIKISELSKVFHVSPRTINYDLDKIDVFLKGNNMPLLLRKQRVGVQFIEPSKYKSMVLSLLSKINNYAYTLKPEEREKVILSELFQTKNYITMEHLAELLSVSRGTVINDLKKVKSWLLSKSLKLKSSHKHGIKILGDEQDLRRAAVALISENVEIDKVLDIIKAPLTRRVNVAMDQQVKKLFEDLDIELIKNAVKMAEEQLETIFSDVAYSGLVIHLALAIKRIQLGKDINMPKDELSGLKLTKEFAVASSIVKMLEESFNIKIPIDEIGYITIHLLGGKINATNNYVRENWAKLQVLTAKIIEKVQSKIEVDFSTDDELYKGLIEHLCPTIYRLKHGLPLKNPILEEIKTNYPGIFGIVKGGLKVLEDFVGKDMPDEEVGYIAIHFGAALERKKALKKYKCRVMIVCGTGIGTAKLLASRVKAEFVNMEIVGTVAVHQVKETVLTKDADLILSTLPTNCEKLPEIVVNPLLPKEDVMKITQFLSSYTPVSRYIKELPKPSIQTFMDIIERNCVIKTRKSLIQELSELIDIPGAENCTAIRQPELKDLLSDKTIRTNIKAGNWEEAVRAGGNILIENDFVEQRYVDAMVEAVKELGPYIIIAPGIAMPLHELDNITRAGGFRGWSEQFSKYGNMPWCDR